MSSQHRRDIDGLRALAVLPVVLYHAGVPGFSGGFTGVDVFFVISGFLITQMIANDLREGRFSISDFYARRVRRIVPALVVVLAAVSLVAVVFFTPIELQRYGLSLASASMFAANIFFWRTANYFNAEAEPSALLHTWSLAVEEQYYIFWPLVLIAIFAVGLQRYLRPLAIAALLLSFIVSLVLVQMSAQFSFYMLPTRAWELLLGAVIGLGAIPTLNNARLREALGAAGIAAVVAGAVWLNNRTETPGLWLLLPCVGAGLVIYSGAGGSTVAARLLSVGPLVWFGLISYSLYLWHWPLLVLPPLILARELTGLEIGLAILLSVALAWATWRFVEQPFRRQSLTPPGQVRRFLIGGSAALILLGGVGIFFAASRGLAWRADANAIVADNAVIHDTSPPCLMSERASGGRSELPPSEPCTFGANPTAKPQIVLWGDSHSNHLRGAMEDWAKAKGVTARQVSKAMCPPLIGVSPTLAPRNTRADCRRFNDGLMALVQSEPSIRQVILAARWPLYLDRGYPRHGVSPILTREDHVPPDASKSMEDFEASLDSTVKALVGRGVNVVLIAPLPDFFQSASKCVARARMFGWSESRCAADFGDTWLRMNQVSAALKGVATRYSGVKVIETAPLFCHLNVCSPTKDGTMMFRDDNHVTPAGAKLIVDQIPAP